MVYLPKNYKSSFKNTQNYFFILELDHFYKGSVNLVLQLSAVLWLLKYYNWTLGYSLFKEEIREEEE